MAYIPESGITYTHYGVFEQAARALNRAIIVRNTNAESTPWIDLGYPPKPRTIKIHTSETTGKVTCVNTNEIRTARAVGFYVIDADGMARNAAGKALPTRLKLGDEREQDEAGQVIHPGRHKALVGDYDLLAVIDPLAPGRNIVLAAQNGEAVEDRLGPEAERLMEFANPLFDQPRIMHGAHDQWDDLPEKGSTVFFTDGSSELIGTRDEMANFYKFIGRSTIKGGYESGQPAGPLPVNVIPFPFGR